MCVQVLFRLLLYQVEDALRLANCLHGSLLLARGMLLLLSYDLHLLLKSLSMFAAAVAFIALAVAATCIFLPAYLMTYKLCATRK